MPEERKQPEGAPAAEDTELMEGDLEKLEELLDELEEAVRDTAPVIGYKNTLLAVDTETDQNEEEPEPAEPVDGEEAVAEMAELRARPQTEEERRITIPDVLP